MKIVILERDSLGTDISVDAFHEFGEVVAYRNTVSKEQIIERIKDAEIILANKAPLSKDVLEKADKLKYVVITATGYNNVDAAYCKERGIKVSNIAGYSTASVAQHTLAMALYLIEKIEHYNNYVKSGAYSAQSFFTNFDKPFYELAGKTWGIVGLGAIGSKVAEIATCLDCKVIYYSPHEEKPGIPYRRVDFDTLLEESDVISLHCPLTDETRNMFNMEAFEKMNGNTILINMARGPVVNEEDLCKALEEEYLCAAGLDVFGQEPISSDSPLLKIQDNSKLVLSPHTAWATVESRTRCVNEAYLNVEAYINGIDRNVVNL